MCSTVLLASEYSNWIDSDIEIDEEAKKFIEFFVIGTPSIGLSSKERSLYSYYNYKTVKEYEELWRCLCEGIDDCFCADTYKDLSEKIAKHEWLGFRDMPSDVTEAIYIYVGEYTKDELFKEHFSSLPPITINGKSNIDRKEETEPRRKITYVNKLFRHIRNSFAHGRYTIFENEIDTYYIFQDSNTKGHISARIVITETRLNSWIELLERNHEACIVEETERKVI